jgi:fumarate hydratase class I
MARMIKLRDGLVELYKKVATSIPKDIEDALRIAVQRETDLAVKESLANTVGACIAARTSASAICEDSGLPVFYAKVPKGLSQLMVRDVIIEATTKATQMIPLRPNAIDSLSGEPSQGNVGILFPIIFTEETNEGQLTIDLMLRGGISETLSMTYQLPQTLSGDIVSRLTMQGVAERDLNGIRACVINAVLSARGKGCPPYIIGVGIGGAKEQVALLSSRQLLRKVYDIHAESRCAQLEAQLLDDINTYVSGTPGFVGRTTALAVKVGIAHRHPESFLVDISFSCWAHRRGRFIW